VEELDAAHQVAKIAPEVIEELAEDDVEFDWVELADYDTVRGVDGALWTLQNAKRQDATAKNTKRGAWRQALAALKVKAAQIERLAVIRAELAEKKIPEVSHRYSWEYTSARPLDDLVSGIGRPLTEQGHAETCEGHAAAIDEADGHIVWLCANYKKYGHRIAGTPDGGGAEQATEQVVAERRPSGRPPARSV
jgi:ParB family chromosome partitioning protein